MSIEFYRPECQRPVDADGFELAPWDNPYFAIPDDDDQDEPDQADVAWLNENPPPISGGAPEWEPSEADWADYHEHCMEQDRLDALRRMDDHEYELRIRYGD